MNEGAAIRVLSFLNESNQQHLASLANEKRKVIVIGEEHEMEQEEDDGDDQLQETSTTLLSSQKIKEFFDAVEEGSVEEVEELFKSLPNVDANMTRYTESLLMAAIRAKRYKVAEFLIDRIGIDVNHSTHLLEFRPQTRMPIRQQSLNCRELAYDRGMMDLVDLIDIASDEVKPGIKRFLQKRLKHRLDEIHQAHLKRLKEQTSIFAAPVDDKEIRMIEEGNEEREMDDSIKTEKEEETPRNSRLPRSQPPPIQQSVSVPTSARPYHSHIEETLEKLELSNEKSIDNTGKKLFRFSNYTVRFRLVESDSFSAKPSETNRIQSRSHSLPHIVPPSARSVAPATPAPSVPRPTTGASSFNQPSRYSFTDFNNQAPIRENRTSICRSARCVSTPRVVQPVNPEPKPEPKPKSLRTSSQRLIPKRLEAISTSYLSHMQQPIYYNESNHYVPLTLRTTAIGLPLTTHRLIRD